MVVEFSSKLDGTHNEAALHRELLVLGSVTLAGWLIT